MVWGRDNTGLCGRPYQDEAVHGALRLCGVLQVKTEDIRTTDQGALMHVLATTAEVLVVVCGHGPASEKAALQHITAVDPPSAKVQLKEVLTAACRTACSAMWSVV